MDPFALLYPIACCVGLVLFILAVVVVIFAIKDKKALLAILVGIPLLCIGCSIMTGAVLFWSDSDTYIPDDLSDQYFDYDYYDDDSADYDYSDEDVWDTDEVVGDGGGLPADGYVLNEAYDFAVYVGDYDNGFWSESDVDGATTSFTYCLATSTSDAGSLCGSGYFPVFDITVMTWDQWSDHISEDSMGMDWYTKVGDDADYVYLFSHPNGDYPNDVPHSEAFFDGVISGFDASE